MPVKFAIWPPVTKPTLQDGGEAEEIEEPARGHVLDHGRRGAAGVQAGVLVPGGDQPVRGQGRGHAAPDHEAEVARPGAGDDPAVLGGGGQALDDLERGLAVRGQGPAQALGQAFAGGGGGDRALAQGGQELLGQGGGTGKERIAHRAIP